MRDLNQIQHGQVGDPETLTRIAQYELAYRMQVAVPEVMDISKEPQHVPEMYGAKSGHVSQAESADDPHPIQQLGKSLSNLDLRSLLTQPPKPRY